jgi:hypothetical protein
MTTQLLIYNDAAPVTRIGHGNCYVEVGATFGFSANINSVPLMAVEFPHAAHEYAIVFGGTGAETTPAVILGVRGTENLFLAEDGTWTGKYVPAFLRRYPFVFSQSDDRLVLCIDEAFPGLNRENRGQPLFADDGSPSPYVDGVVKFLQDYQGQFEATKRVCARLVALNLLEPMQAQVTMPEGPNVSLGGFMAVNREKLKALPRETLAEMAKSDELEMIHLHLHSLRNFDALRDRLAARIEGEKANAVH